MRTYSRADWLAARDAWDNADFGPRWDTIRSIARHAGFIYPPSGSVHDDREAQSPSQRAVVWRALEDNPTRLEAIVRRSRSWSEVVDGIIGLETRLRLDADDEQRVIDWQNGEQPDHREAITSLGSIIGRIRDSVP